MKWHLDELTCEHEDVREDLDAKAKLLAAVEEERDELQRREADRERATEQEQSKRHGELEAEMGDLRIRLRARELEVEDHLRQLRQLTHCLHEKAMQGRDSTFHVPEELCSALDSRRARPNGCGGAETLARAATDTQRRLPAAGSRAGLDCSSASIDDLLRSLEASRHEAGGLQASQLDELRRRLRARRGEPDALDDELARVRQRLEEGAEELGHSYDERHRRLHARVVELDAECAALRHDAAEAARGADERRLADA
eukprot:gene18865-24086_t